MFAIQYPGSHGSVRGQSLTAVQTFNYISGCAQVHPDLIEIHLKKIRTL